MPDIKQDTNNESYFKRTIFTDEMKKTHTILVPNMLPIHFKLICRIFSNYGYNVRVLESEGTHIADQGLKNVHNDTCYPALLVIGQFIDALESGEYDLSKVALMITQTGGGCRASNYIYLLRKALQKRGYGNIPVLSLNFSGLDKDSSFKITLPMGIQLLYSVLLGDLIMLLSNQCRPYETTPGATDEAERQAVSAAHKLFAKGRLLGFGSVKKTAAQILDIYGQVKRELTDKVKVGVVGEIYVKYAPLGNNNLEDFLHSVDAEVVMPGLMGFLMYCVCNTIYDHEIYGNKEKLSKIYNIIYQYLLSKEKVIIDLIKKHPAGFRANQPFNETAEGVGEYMSHGVKMGEGWLLTAEMVELIHSGVPNIVCAQPFGCLPNHIAGKGMIRKIKQKNPEANIVAIDYDPGATRINQENRIKLMIAGAQENRPTMSEEDDE